MKILVKPKINAFQLAKIREGFELFEELDASGALSCSCLRELLKRIQRFDLLEKLDVPSFTNAEGGKRNYVESVAVILFYFQISCTVPVKGIAASHVRIARALQAYYTQCPRSSHAVATQYPRILHASTSKCV